MQRVLDIEEIGRIVEQFLLDGTNQRTDRYGGVVENRARFPFDPLDAVMPNNSTVLATSSG